MEQYKEFINQFVDMAGKNYGYEIETSTETQIPDDVLDEIYRQMWIQYGINDIKLYSSYCDTCFGYHPDRSFHLGWETVFSPDVKLGAAWTEKRLKENRDNWNHIQSVIKDLNLRENAVEIREAFSLLNVAERTKLGYESYPNIKIVKSVLDEIYALNHEELTEKFNKLKGFIIEVDELENGHDYTLTEEK